MDIPCVSFLLILFKKNQKNQKHKQHRCCQTAYVNVPVLHAGIHNLVKIVDQQATDIFTVGDTATMTKIPHEEMSCYFWWYLACSNIPGPEQK